MEKHAKLTDWIVQNNGHLHADVEIVHNPEKGYHVVVRKERAVEALTRVASCPTSAMISVLNALDVTPFRCHGTKFPRAFLIQNSHTVVQTFFLMEQYLLRARSWWYPYITTLPTPKEVADLRFVDNDDLAFLEGTNLSFAVSKQRELWECLYSNGVENLRTLEWPNTGLYTFELFQWASVIFGSRSFTSQVLSATLPADRASPIADYNGLNQRLTQLFSDGFPVLLPLVDILNHKPYARVEWQARFSFVGLQLLDKFEGGRELFNNYGPRDNETLLLAYSFTIPNNPFDHFTVGLKVPPQSPLTETRTWDKNRSVGSTYNLYVFGSKHPKVSKASCLETSLFSFDLLDSISVLFANDREMHSMSLRKETLMGRALRKHGEFRGYRNLLATIAQILQDCKVKAFRLRRTDPAQPPTSQKQRYAQTYRNSQKRILETAVCLCQLILLRAISERSASEILSLSRVPEYVDESVLIDVKSLVRQHVFRSRNNELFTCEHMISMLGRDAYITWQRYLDEIVHDLNETRKRELDMFPDGFTSNEMSTLDTAKVRFALILSALATEYARGEPLTQRLKSWMRRLTSWYPTDDSNWSYVPDDRSTAPENAPPPTLMTLLKTTRHILESRSEPTRNSITDSWSLPIPSASASDRWLKDEMLCWGWNVMEEEGIAVTMDVIDEERVFDWDENRRTLVLYIPQL